MSDEKLRSEINNLNYGHIYKINDVIKVKCIIELPIHCNDMLIPPHIKLGEVYMCNKTTSKDYYFIHKIQTMLPSEFFIPLSDWREQTINEIIK